MMIFWFLGGMLENNGGWKTPCSTYADIQCKAFILMLFDQSEHSDQWNKILKTLESKINYGTISHLQYVIQRVWENEHTIRSHPTLLLIPEFLSQAMTTFFSLRLKQNRSLATSMWAQGIFLVDLGTKMWGAPNIATFIFSFELGSFVAFIWPRTQYTAKAGLILIIYMPWPFKCWYYRHIPLSCLKLLSRFSLFFRQGFI